MTAPSANTPHVPALTVTTSKSPLQGPPLAHAVDASPLLFQRRGRGLMGFGEAVRAEFSGPDRFRQASTWWSEVVARASVSDMVNQAGSGLVAFGAFTFADTSQQTSVLIVPQRIIGVGEHGVFETTISTDPRPTGEPASVSMEEPHPPTTWQPGAVPPERFIELVEGAKHTITQDGLHKVVIARDLVAVAPGGFSPVRSLEQLTEAYPDTFVFSVDGLFGASPETLASVRGQAITLRVLAGSAARGSNPESDLASAEALATSTKDLDEHRFAVGSVIESLAAVGIDAVADDIPFTLKLPNLWHLATDVVATVPEGLGSLDVIQALHPTAAVAGSPTEAALAFIDTHEGLDRGRYAGPVGWIDAKGDGDWAIALRCAQYDPRAQSLTAYAGAGIVADSDPQQELLETTLKFRPITEAIT